MLVFCNNKIAVTTTFFRRQQTDDERRKREEDKRDKGEKDMISERAMKMGESITLSITSTAKKMKRFLRHSDGRAL